MAATNFKKGEEVSLLDANAIELEYTTQPIPVPMDLFIDVDSANAGTIQFQVLPKNQTLAGISWAGIKAWSAGSKPYFSIRNGDQNLYAKASAGTQKFTGTY